ncbi:hypothetical protein KJZ61_00170 [Candidatus Dependentiae bacterium]|nr:hypothetical protein [Candidatus Dependentiae bacterium]
MKGLIRGICGIIMVLFVGRPCTYALKILYSCPLITTHVIEYDVRLSSQAKQEISQFITREPIFKTSRGKEQYQLIRRHFPFIQNYACTIHPDGTGHLSLYADNALGIIDNASLVFDNLDLTDTSCFNSSYLDTLPRLYLDKSLGITGNQCNKACADFMKHIDWRIAQYYNYLWYGANYITLIRKDSIPLSIVCCNDHIPSPTLIASCEQLWQNNNELKKNDKDPLIMDTRFRGQIIVHSCKKGGHDGKNVC